TEFRSCKAELQAAQDRRLQRQRAIGAQRLEVERARHDLAMAEERGRSQATLAEAALAEAAELQARLEAALALSEQLTGGAARAGQAAREASDASTQLRRLRAELDGLEALRPTAAPQLKPLGDVIVARAGHEAALSAVLGPLVEAWAAPDQAAATRFATSGKDQVTALYPDDDTVPEPRSLVEQVVVEPGFEGLARRLLGRVVVGRDVSLDGVYHAPGLVRAGSDPRVKLAARRRRLREEMTALEPTANESKGR